MPTLKIGIELIMENDFIFSLFFLNTNIIGNNVYLKELQEYFSKTVIFEKINVLDIKNRNN